MLPGMTGGRRAPGLPAPGTEAGQSSLSWPHARGAVIGLAAGLVLAGNPLLGLAFVAFEVWWVRGLRGRGVPSSEVRAVAWTAAGVGVAVLVATGAVFALFLAPVRSVEGAALARVVTAR